MSLKNILFHLSPIGAAVLIFSAARVASLFQADGFGGAFCILMLGMGLGCIYLKECLALLSKAGLYYRDIGAFSGNIRESDAGPGAFRLLGWTFIIVSTFPIIGKLS